MIVDFGQLDWLAIAVAALATFFLGALWYQALFGKAWVRLHGYSPEDVQRMQAARPPHVFLGGMLLCYLVLATVVALLVGATGSHGAAGGMTLGFLLWVGPAAAIGITSYLASNKPFGVYAIDLGFQLVFLLLQGAILGGWTQGGAA